MAGKFIEPIFAIGLGISTGYVIFNDQVKDVSEKMIDEVSRREKGEQPKSEVPLVEKSVILEPLTPEVKEPTPQPPAVTRKWLSWWPKKKSDSN